MFNLFRNKNLTAIMEKILEKTFAAMDEPKYIKQIKQGTIKKLVPSFDNKGFDIFYTSKVEDFEDISKPDIIFSNIKVVNKKDQSTELKITIISNLIAGIDYTNSNFDFSVETEIDASKYIKSSCLTDDYFKECLQKAEIDINLAFKPSQIYSISINGLEYIHIKDINNGDFIALYDKKLYWVSHDDLIIHTIPKALENKLKLELASIDNDELEKLLNEYCY